jgi:hypothetical protein
MYWKGNTGTPVPVTLPVYVPTSSKTLIYPKKILDFNLFLFNSKLIFRIFPHFRTTFQCKAQFLAISLRNIRRNTAIEYSFSVEYISLSLTLSHIHTVKPPALYDSITHNTAPVSRSSACKTPAVWAQYIYLILLLSDARLKDLSVITKLPRI